MRHVRTATRCAMLLCLLAQTAPLHSQVADSTCTYRLCSLRMEPRAFGVAVVRGPAGDPVARVGMWGTRPALSSIVQRSDSALFYARRYERFAPRVAITALASSGLLALAAVGRDHSEGASIGVGIAAIGLSFYGVSVTTSAQRALSRSVWWYNESLVR